MKSPIVFAKACARGMPMSDRDIDTTEDWLEKAHRFYGNIRAWIVLGIGVVLLLANLGPDGFGQIGWWSFGFIALGSAMLSAGRRKK